MNPPASNSSNLKTLSKIEFHASEVIHSKPYYWWLGVLVVVVICIASFWLAIHPEWVKWFGRWGYVGAFVISMIASATIILPAPGIAVVIAMGATLDPIMLGIAAGVGSAVGELSGYFAGYGGRALIPKSQRQQFEQIHRLTDKYGSVILAFLAAIPFPLFDLAGIVAGVLRMNLLAFLISVTIGKTLKYIFLVYLGTVPLHILQQFFS